MNFRRATITLMAFCALAGCGIAEKRQNEFNAGMNSWIGKHTDTLFVAKGPPTNSVTLSNGGKVLEFSRAQLVTSGGGSYTVFVPHYNPASKTSVMVPQQRAIPVTSALHDCKLLFKVSAENRIETWSAEGNSCF